MPETSAHHGCGVVRIAGRLRTGQVKLEREYTIVRHIQLAEVLGLEGLEGAEGATGPGRPCAGHGGERSLNNGNGLDAERLGGFFRRNGTADRRPPQAEVALRRNWRSDEGTCLPSTRSMAIGR